MLQCCQHAWPEALSFLVAHLFIHLFLGEHNSSGTLLANFFKFDKLSSKCFE